MPWRFHFLLLQLFRRRAARAERPSHRRGIAKNHLIAGAPILPLPKSNQGESIGQGCEVPYRHVLPCVQIPELFNQLEMGTHKEVVLVHRGDRLSLWHERFGRGAAVWLFDLAASAPDTLATIEAHQCGADLYNARLALTPAGFDLRWTITGPRKHETLAYAYSR